MHHTTSNPYPFGWLDELLFRRISTTDRPTLPEDLESRISRELWQIFQALKSQTFGSSVFQEIQLIVGQYLEAAEWLSTKAKEQLAGLDEQSPLLETLEYLVADLEEFIRTIEKRYARYLEEKRPRLKAGADKVLFKVLCKLSVDQLGILLRACDDSRLLVARSLSAVFQTIVPYLSTDKTTEISWRSMRKSSYQFEAADLERVVEVLEKLIAVVKGYF